MYLPDAVLNCLHKLEEGGYPCYAVGGCVRNALLGRTPHDYDLCTAATPGQMKVLFREFPLVLAGEKHGTVGVVTEQGVVEITTFRTEGDYQDHRHPDKVCFVTEIEADLARRDFTVNAMAWSPVRGFQDPFGGREDLKQGTLRAVGTPELRFREDALRILRGVRFAVSYGLNPEPQTLRAMTELTPLIDSLARERVFEELCKLLPLVKAEDLLRYAPILTQVIPELAPAVGFDQRSPHHAYDLYTHIAYVTGAVSGDLALRWAALLHDIGKVPAFTLDENGRGHFYGHAAKSAEMAEQILLRMKAPNLLRHRVVTLIGLHMTKLEPEKKCLRRWLSRLGEDALEQLLVLQEGDLRSKGVEEAEALRQFVEIRELLLQIRGENGCLCLKDLAVNGHDLMALGITGPEIGKTLHRLLELVMEEKTANEKDALLKAARERR